MKDRFNILDTYAIIKELQHFNSYRVNNIYDIDNKTFLIKFDDFDQKRKCFIIIKSGQYLYHIYNPPQDRRKLPSSFCMKLRKHIKNKRLQSIEMLKCDRVIQFTFGTNEHQYKLIIELFSFGNIILCDKNSTMLTLLRTHVYDNGNTILVNHPYPIQQLNDKFNPPTIKEDIEKIKKTTGGYQTYKGVCPLPLENQTTPTTPTFNDALNNYIKINTNTHITTKKKIKRSPEESIRIHAKQKIKKLQENIENLNKQIEWMYQNETLVKELLQSLPIIDKDHHILFIDEHKKKNYKFVKTLNYHQNINHLYGTIKKLTEKINKTEIGSEEAITKIKNLQKKESNKKKEKDKIKSSKIILSTDKWYQEYHWFYTSHQFLVICGKNSTQSETIVKKHMNANDIYLHSEVSGSGSAILINSVIRDRDYSGEHRYDHQSQFGWSRGKELPAFQCRDNSVQCAYERGVWERERAIWMQRKDRAYRCGRYGECQ